MSIHIAIDLETLSTRPNAAVVSMGWCVFDAEKTLTSCARILTDWHLHGRHVDADTVSWWMSQPDTARDFSFAREFRTEEGETLTHLTSVSLIDLGGIMKAYPVEYVWASPVSFDLPILGSLYDDLGLTRPWNHRQERDGRTLRALAAQRIGDAVKIEPEIPHHPMYDAIALAKSVLQNAKAVGFEL